MQATFSIVTESGELRRAELTGPFFAPGADATYTVDLERPRGRCRDHRATRRLSRRSLALRGPAAAGRPRDARRPRHGGGHPYVVVLALPDILTGVGVGLDELQRATP